VGCSFRHKSTVELPPGGWQLYCLPGDCQQCYLLRRVAAMLPTEEVGSTVACPSGWQLCCLPRRLAACCLPRRLAALLPTEGGWQLYRTQTPFHACNIASSHCQFYCIGVDGCQQHVDVLLLLFSPSRCSSTCDLAQ
jgi:hypothetical protein